MKRREEREKKLQSARWKELEKKQYIKKEIKWNGRKEETECMIERLRRHAARR